MAGPPEVPSRYGLLSPAPGAVLGSALDVLSGAAGEIRRASMYVGLLTLLLGTPLAMLFWRAAIQPLAFMPPATEGPWVLALLVAAAGLLVATIESRAIGASLLAARLAGEPLDVRAALQRSRTIFWRLVIALLLANVPVFLVQAFLEGRTAELLRGVGEPSVILAALLAAVLFSPLAYTTTGVVLGDAGPLTAVRRSIGLFRARKLTAVIVALFEFGAQFLTAFGILTGLEVVLGAVGLTGFSGTDPAGAVVTVIVIVALLVALGSLTLTVATIAIAPQVVAFTALTHVAPGLQRIGGHGSTFRWLTRPMLVGVALGTIALFSGLAAFD